MSRLIIHEPVAGSRERADQLPELAARLGAELVRADSPGEATRLAAAAVGCEAVIAAGGDGTVRDVVNGLMTSEARPAARLGILPLGTGNDNARNLGLLRCEDTVAVVEAGHTRRIDLLTCDLTRDGATVRHYGVLNCGIGFGARVIRKTTSLVKRVFGPNLAYTVGTLRALWGWPSPVMRLTHDDGEFEGRVLFLGLGNGEYEGGGTMRLSPGARLDDGLMRVVLIHHGPKLEVLRNFTTIASGEHINHPLVDYFPTRRLTVTADRPLGIQTDGDIVGEAPVTVTVLPLAIEVYAPPAPATEAAS